MIATVDISIQAANPSLPLFPMRAFEGSPSSIRIRNVPKRVGDWVIDKVHFVVIYPDNTTQTIECKLVGGVYVGTVAGCNTIGNVKNGYSIFADGKDENGNAVTDYCLGKGDVQILDASGITQPLQNATFVQILSAHPATPNDGDMWYENDAWYVWQNGQAMPLGDDSAIIGNLSERVDELSAELSAYALSDDVQNELATKANVSSLNDYELKADLQNDVSAIVTARKQNWNCTPSQYNGYDIIIKVVQDGESIQPFANDQAIGASIGFNQETVQDGDKFYWASPGTADINLTAAYVAEPKNALGLAFESELSAKADVSSLNDYELKSDLSSDVSAIVTSTAPVAEFTFAFVSGNPVDVSLYRAVKMDASDEPRYNIYYGNTLAITGVLLADDMSYPQQVQDDLNGCIIDVTKTTAIRNVFGFASYDWVKNYIDQYMQEHQS